MSPLVASPNRGYPDWQRIDNWDSPTLVAINQAATTGTFTSGILDVSRFGYIGGRLRVSTNAAVVTLTYYEDAAATIVVAIRDFVLWANTPNYALLHLPNLGPFVTIGITGVPAGVAWASDGVLIATNRVHPLELIPSFPVLLFAPSTNVGAGLTVNLFPSDYYSGPMSAFIETTGASCFANLLVPNFAGQNQLMDQVGTGTSGPSRGIMIAPMGAWFIQLSNPNGLASTVLCGFTPSTTGAS